jgi:hypothetical protein
MPQKSRLLTTADTKETPIEIALIALTAPDPATYSERLSVLTELAEKHHAISCQILHVALFVFKPASPSKYSSCVAFVAAVHARLAETAAIVHGSVTACRGNFGSSKDYETGLWWPGSLDAFRQVTTLTGGQIETFTAAP